VRNNIFPENHAVYVEKYGRARLATDVAIKWGMRIAFWIPKATNTRLGYVLVVIDFPRQQWLRERASVLRLYVHHLSLFFRTSQSPVNSVFKYYFRVTYYWRMGTLQEQNRRPVNIR
jgi:hypothetical protein